MSSGRRKAEARTFLGKANISLSLWYSESIQEEAQRANTVERPKITAAILTPAFLSSTIYDIDYTEENMSILTLAPENAPGAAISAQVADGFFGRLLGLMGKKALPERQGLLLVPCNCIHMMFMRFPIDAVFLDKEYRIIKIIPHLIPGLGLGICPKAHACLEIPSDTAKRLGWAAGQKLIATGTAK